MTDRAYQTVFTAKDLYMTGKVLTQSDGSRTMYISAGESRTVGITVGLNRAQAVSKGERLDAFSVVYRVVTNDLASAVGVITRNEQVNGATETKATVASTVDTAFGLTESANFYRSVQSVDMPAYDNDAITQSVSYTYNVTFTADTNDCVIDVHGIEVLMTADYA
jgi:hypothetical protein